MIKIENLNKIFNENNPNEFQALKAINLGINSGELVLLKGVSGSGKTTLLNIIATLLKPTSGKVEIKNKIVSKLPDKHASDFRAKEIGFVFQSFELFDSLSVFDNLSIPLIPLGVDIKTIEQKVLKSLKLVNISHKQNQIVNNLSGGEKQRVAIARALVNEPNIILCDEPTANLDYKNSENFINTIKKLHKLNKTIIIATHDTIFEKLLTNKRVINISNGKITDE